MKRKPKYLDINSRYKFFTVTGKYELSTCGSRDDVHTQYYLAEDVNDLWRTICKHNWGSDELFVDDVIESNNLFISCDVMRNIRDAYFNRENERVQSDIARLMRGVYFDVPNSEMSYAIDNTKAYFDEHGWYLIDVDGRKQYEDEKWLRIT